MNLTVNINKFGYHQNILLKSINYCVNSGEIVSIVGKSGCGKTTLLNLIAGHIILQDGDIINPFQTGYIYQTSSLYPWLTIGQNIKLCYKSPHIKSTACFTKEYNRLMALLNIQSVVDLYPSQISGGENQRAVLMKILMLDKELILMDEPFASLDAITRKEMDHLLLKIIKKKDIGIIFVTHNVDEAVLISDKIIVLHDCIHNNNTMFELGHNNETDPDSRLFKAKYLKIKKQIMKLLIN